MRTKDVKEVLYARQSVVMHAKAFGLDAVDLVEIDYKGLLLHHPCTFIHAYVDIHSGQTSFISCYTHTYVRMYIHVYIRSGPFEGTVGRGL